MAYFKSKKIVSILAEKPDMISSFPEEVLSARQLEDMACIPDIALCDITMLDDHRALDQMFLSERPDAVLPAVVYCGVERAGWSAFDSSVATLRKALERTWHVHVLQPVVLGSPMFRSALCLYADMQAEQEVRRALQCAACMFYRAAVYIPLCKKCAVSKLYFGGLAPCCSRIVDIEQSAGLLKYCRILLSGYGIELFMAIPAVNAVRHDAAERDALAVSGFECFASMPGGCDALPADIKPKLLQGYFENFAIPFAANVMSRLLAGHAVDFLAAARSFLPAIKKK